MLSKVVVGRASALRIKGPLCTPQRAKDEVNMIYNLMFNATALSFLVYWSSRGKNSREKLPK